MSVTDGRPLTSREARDAMQCKECRRTPALVRRRIASGWQVLYYCGSCAIAAYGCDSFKAQKNLAPGVFEALPEIVDGQTMCEVCRTPGPIEYHHLAPRAVFGDEADRWPTAAVCRSCHMRWHALMDGRAA